MPHIGLMLDFHQVNAPSPKIEYERTYEIGGRYVLHYGRLQPYAKLMYGRGVFNFPPYPEQPHRPGLGQPRLQPVRRRRRPGLPPQALPQPARRLRVPEVGRRPIPAPQRHQPAALQHRRRLPLPLGRFEPQTGAPSSTHGFIVRQAGVPSERLLVRWGGEWGFAFTANRSTGNGQYPHQRKSVSRPLISATCVFAEAADSFIARKWKDLCISLCLALGVGSGLPRASGTPSHKAIIARGQSSKHPASSATTKKAPAQGRGFLRDDNSVRSGTRHRAPPESSSGSGWSRSR